MGSSCPNWFMNEQELWGSTDWDLGTYKGESSTLDMSALGEELPGAKCSGKSAL